MAPYSPATRKAPKPAISLKRIAEAVIAGLILAAIFASLTFLSSLRSSIPPILPKAPHANAASPLWSTKLDNVPQSDTQTAITQQLNAGQTLMLTGQQWQYGNKSCSGDENRICVLLIHAIAAQTVTVSGLIPTHNWLGISSVLSSKQALSDQEYSFWETQNCDGGCITATVAFYDNNKQVEEKTISPNR